MMGARQFYNMCYIEFLLNCALIWKQNVIRNKITYNNLILINLFKSYSIPFIDERHIPYGFSSP